MFGKDLIIVDEETLIESKPHPEKIHLIKFNFKEPTEEKILKMLDLFPHTNRFIIDDDINKRIYNNTLRNTKKKYYIKNKSKGVLYSKKQLFDSFDLITFFRKNNKILLDLNQLPIVQKDFIIENLLEDILRNVEIIVMHEIDIQKLGVYDKLSNWSGNLIVIETYDDIDENRVEF